MRFKKGSKVEVMNKKPPPSWHVAEIVSGNGDSYDGYQNKVSRRFIKPSLPTKRSLKSFQKEQQEEEDDYRSHKSHVIVSRNQKRVKHCSSQSQSQRYISNDSYKKVDAFVGNNSLNGCYYEMEKRKRTDDDDEESDSDECSVGSCSVVDIVSNDDDDDDDDDDGADGGDDVAVSNDDIHRLELDAYRATLEALYASGPLSWEKEALLTNLRINLHISNDEHLIELRHLISSRVN